MDSLKEKINQFIREKIEIRQYDASWVGLFEEEKKHLLEILPAGIVKRVEHFGSTAIPGMPAKPIIDMLVEVTSLELTREKIVPILVEDCYDYFWRPSWGDDTPPFYAWFIKRDNDGNRTHHIHMVEKDFEHWDRLLFRDYLIEKPEIAREYSLLKLKLSSIYSDDRVSYTKAKHDFIQRVTGLAKEYFGKSQDK